MILQAVRLHPNGIDKLGVIEFVKNNYGQNLNPAHVPTYLWRLVNVDKAITRKWEGLDTECNRQ